MNQTAKTTMAIIAMLALTLSTTSANSKKETKRETVTLTLWTIWSSDSESNKAPFMKTLADFKKKYPNIKIELDQTEAAAYPTKIKTAIAANEAPDVFYYSSGGLLKSFVDAGKILPLDEYLTPEIRERILDGALDNMTFDRKVYGLPYTLACSVLYCNEELFANNNIKIPETWTELMTAVRKFSKVGITPMAVGGKDRWPTNMYGDLIMLRAAGYKECHAAFYREKGGSFTTEGMRLAARRFKELIDAGAFSKDAVALSRDESEVPFYAGKIPMYVSGNWTAGNCQSPISKVRGKIIAVRFPTIEGGKGNINDFMGGAAEEFCVSARTKHPKEAFILCQYLAENHSRNAYLASAGMPTWKMNVDGSKIDPLMKSIITMTKDAPHFLLWANTALNGTDAELFMDTTQEFLAGALTADGYVERLETIGKQKTP
jgi:raffinose/stachyose/melibiose transport system substrate-binding protein